MADSCLVGRYQSKTGCIYPAIFLLKDRHHPAFQTDIDISVRQIRYPFTALLIHRLKEINDLLPQCGLLCMLNIRKIGSYAPVNLLKNFPIIRPQVAITEFCSRHDH